jgi:hypothetical protein
MTTSSVLLISGPLTGDVTTVGNASTLVATANVEAIITANPTVAGSTAAAQAAAAAALAANIASNLFVSTQCS